MQTISLNLTGMTCAACAQRIEKRLNKLDGVRASVNFATNRATVRAEDDIEVTTLIDTVAKSGYGAQLPQPEESAFDPIPALRRQVWVAGLGAVPVIAISMVPAWQFPGWQWVALAVTTIVIGYSGAPFHRSALVNARHGATTMDTLVSLGTLAAYGWSLIALIFGTAGRLDLRHEFHFALSAGAGLDNVYLEAACGIIFFVLIGRFIEARSRQAAGAAVRSLLECGAKSAVILRDGGEVEVDIADVLVGDEFVVRPGTAIATDGVVIAGNSALDATLVTGEALPVEVGPGDAVIGGTLNTHGRLVVRATRVGADTQLAQLAVLVEEAQAGKASVQRLADRVSAVFVPVVLGLSLATLATWLIAGFGWAFAGQAAVAVLIIACPCALGLATPTALLVGSGRGATLGIAIKGPEVLERVRQVRTVFLDKTGTLTTGRMRLATTAAVGRPWVEVLAFAAAAESGSEHPIARVIAGAAQPGYRLQRLTNHPGQGVIARVFREGIEHEVAVGRPELLGVAGVAGLAGLPGESVAGHEGGKHEVAVGAASPLEGPGCSGAPDHSDQPATILAAVAATASGVSSISVDVDELSTLAEPGTGVRSPGESVAGHEGVEHEVAAGRPELLGVAGVARLAGARSGTSLPPTLVSVLATARDRGETAVLVAVDGIAVGVIGLADEIRPDAKAAIAELRRLDIEPVLLTGDQEAAAQTVAAAVGIERVHAGASPTDKAEIVAAEQTRHQVAMVGDGVNDAAALALADVGIAMGQGTDAARTAADITLLGSDIKQVATALRLSKATLRTIYANLFWAFGYNVAAIPLAAMGYLNPMIAGAAMAFSSVFVVLNSLRLRSFR